MRYQECLEKGLRVVGLARQLGEPNSEASARFSGARASIVLGDIEGAGLHAATMLDLTEKIRDRSNLASPLLVNERKCSLEGDWAAARAFNDRAQAALSKDPRLLGTRVQIEYQVGEFQQGDVHLEGLREVMSLTPPGPTLTYGYPAAVIPLMAWITGLPN